MNHNILIETTFKGKSCLSCVYMEEAVWDVLPKYGGRVTYGKVDIFSDGGKERFLELSCALFGEAGVFKHHRLAPIPSLFIEGELIFDAIPDRDELEAAIEEHLMLPKCEREKKAADTGDSKYRGNDRHAEKSGC